MPNNDNISYRSDEFQDVLGKMPGWITRNGTTLVFVCVAIFIIGSWFFKYPDVISSRIVVTTENPPANLIARSSGQIQNLYVEENQKVQKGEILAIIENPGKYQHILELKQFLLSSKEFFLDYNKIRIDGFESDYMLGELQSDYSGFLKEFNDYQHFLELNYYPRKISSLRNQYGVVSQNVEWAGRQLKAIQNEYDLELKQFRRDSSLFEKEVLAPSEFEKRKAALLSKKYEMEGTQSALASRRLEQIELDQKIIDAEKEFSDTRIGYRLKMREAYNNLLSAISSWELNYVLTAPVGGVVTLNKYWSETQNVKEGEIVMTVIPDLPSEIIGKLELPIRGSGKVKTGQKVNIKFDNYPYMEYGLVRGYINNVSLVPTNDVYMVEVEFPDGVVTNYGISLELSREIQGTAEIITDELRLIQRFFNPIKSLFKERMLD